MDNGSLRTKALNLSSSAGGASIKWGDDDEDEEMLPLSQLKNSTVTSFIAEQKSREREPMFTVSKTICPPVTLPSRPPLIIDPTCLVCQGNTYIFTTDNFVFQLDLLNRPIVMVSPKNHVSRLSELTNDEKSNFIGDIQQFLEIHSIDTYDLLLVSHNKTNTHYFCKIKISKADLSRLSNINA